MGNQKALFKQADVSRAVKGVRSAGLDVSEVKIDREGCMIIVIGKENDKSDANANSWDAVLK